MSSWAMNVDWPKCSFPPSRENRGYASRILGDGLTAGHRVLSAGLVGTVASFVIVRSVGARGGANGTITAQSWIECEARPAGYALLVASVAEVLTPFVLASVAGRGPSIDMEGCGFHGLL